MTLRSSCEKKAKTGTTVVSVSSKLRRGAINWEPPYPEGEDESSMKKHREALQIEWLRARPDKEKIDKRMMLTFPDRRRLMNKKVDLTEVKAEYPALFDYSQVECTCMYIYMSAFIIL